MAACLAFAPACAPGSDDALRDAWALWIEYEPTCAEMRAPPADSEAGSPRWRRAFAALADETLSVMEERLAEGSRRPDDGRRLAELTAAARRLCELARVDPPIGALASTIATLEADVAALESRLAVALPLTPEEVYRRSGRFSTRLANAVSDALAAREVEIGTGADRDLEAAVDPVPPPRPDESPAGPEPIEPAGAAPLEPKIRIGSVSGESIVEIRRRRAARVAGALERWRPLLHEALRPLAALRVELDRGLERESLEGLHELCGRLGATAAAVPAEMVAAAPDDGLRADLARMLEGYAAAGRACAADRAANAWSHLDAADQRWSKLAAEVERLAAGSSIPRSLIRRSRTAGER